MTDTTTTQPTDDVAAALAPLLAEGFTHHDHEQLRPGVRVRNRGEQYDDARQFGTAVVVAVLRKPGAWEQKWGRMNIEVLVRRERPRFGNELAWWADYGTALPEGCWLCGGTDAACRRCAPDPTTTPTTTGSPR